LLPFKGFRRQAIARSITAAAGKVITEWGSAWRSSQPLPFGSGQH